MNPHPYENDPRVTPLDSGGCAVTNPDGRVFHLIAHWSVVDPTSQAVIATCPDLTWAIGLILGPTDAGTAAAP